MSDIRVIITKQCIRLVYSKTRLKTLYKMLVVSGLAHKSWQNIFPMQSYIIDRGHKAAVIIPMAPVFNKILFGELI